MITLQQQFLIPQSVISLNPLSGEHMNNLPHGHKNTCGVIDESGLNLWFKVDLQSQGAGFNAIADSVLASLQTHKCILRYISVTRYNF